MAADVRKLGYMREDQPAAALGFNEPIAAIRR
jgi:hypothetical protein